MPDEWRLALEASTISKDEVISHSDAVINVLTYQFRTPPEPTMKDMMDVNAMLHDSKCPFFKSSPESFIREEDPRLYYRGLKEVLGSGGYSTV